MVTERPVVDTLAMGDLPPAGSLSSQQQKGREGGRVGAGGGPASREAEGPWWTGSSSSPELPAPPDGNGSGAAAKGGGLAGGSAVGEGREEGHPFWRSEYQANEFASVRRASERVTLNLSGTIFITTRDTLARNPLTYFAAMLRMQALSPSTTPTAAEMSAAEGQDGGAGGGGGAGGSGGGGGAGGGVGVGPRRPSSSSSASSDGLDFFIDRDPTHFRFILNYLRDSYIGLDSFGKDDLHFLEELSHEAQFFNIGGLCSDISRRMTEIARKHREGPSGDKDFRLVQCNTQQIQELFHEWVIEKNYEFECMQIVGETAFIVLGRRVSRGELALVERLMKT